MGYKKAEIDDIDLDISSLDVPKLHAKYSDLLNKSVKSSSCFIFRLFGIKKISSKKTRDTL
mgnify:CR=1 FL=1